MPTIMLKDVTLALPWGPKVFRLEHHSAGAVGRYIKAEPPTEYLLWEDSVLRPDFFERKK